MNWLDLVLIILCGSGFFVGWKIGLFGAIFTTVGLFTGTLFAAQFSDDLADLLTNLVSSDTVAKVLAYSVILLAVLIGAQIAKKMAQRIFKMVLLGWVDKLGSLALGLIAGLVLSCASVTLLARYSSDLSVELLELTQNQMVHQLPLEELIDRSGLQASVQNALVQSRLVSVFLQIHNRVPGYALGFVPDDFRLGIEVLEVEIERKQT
tara:strand:- start:1208 stop:1831 length:624 start_codon:yes stop_codon:yes gene_type:complete